MALMALLACAAVPAWPQVTADPGDPLYRDLDRWEQQGFLAALPPLRPYPLQLVLVSLHQVADRAGPADAALARAYLGSLEGGSLPVALHAAATYELEAKGAAILHRPGVDLESSGMLGSLLGYSIRGRLLTETGTGGEVFPRWADTYQATLANEAPPTGTTSSLPISVGGVSFKGYGVLTGMLSFGTDRMWIQGGLTRASYGPVLESPVLGPQAPQAGYFSATYRGSWFTYTAMVGELVAVYGVQPDGQLYPLSSTNTTLTDFPQKNIIMQSISLSPAPWIQADIFQTIISGGRFSPTYLLPFPLYVQAFLGDWDNAFVGVAAKLTLPYGIRPSALLYIDDLDMAKLLHLNFDTNGNKVALQAGISWAPPLALPAQLSVTYTAITPYTYTHFSHLALNYLQYTNLGQQLGSVLPPNSDQWSIRLMLAPLAWLRLEAWGRQIRHGNGSDYGQGSVSGDGSVYDDSTLQSGTVTYLSHSSFLTQAVLETVRQLGLDVTTDLAFFGMRARLVVSYALESVENRGLNAAAPTELNQVLGLNLSMGF